MKSCARQQPAANPPPGRTAVIYVRVSSKEQEQGFSIPAQRQLLSEYAQREGIHVVQDYGEFYWLGQLHQGLHKPIISRDLFARVQDVFAAANHPRHTSVNTLSPVS